MVLRFEYKKPFPILKVMKFFPQFLLLTLEFVFQILDLNIFYPLHYADSIKNILSHYQADFHK